VPWQGLSQKRFGQIMATSHPTTLGGPVTLDGLAGRTSRHGKVLAVSMMKDEGPYLVEWVAHHIAVGFTDILVYTNDCTDGTDTMLRRMEALGIAMHRENRVPKGIKPQPSAIKHAQVEPEVGDADWVMVFDADEFLSIRHGDGTLDELIGAIEAEGGNGMVVTWRIFGSGGIRDWSRAPVTEQYLMAAPPMWNKGWGVKTLFRFDPEAWKLGIHRPKMRNKVLDTAFPDTVKWLNGSGRPMEDYFKFRGWRSIARTVGYDWAQMNHYAVKSVDAYAMRRARGNVNDKKDKYSADYWALQDRNEVRDETMLRYSARRGAIIAALLSDPELNRLHIQAVEAAEARLAAFKATPDYAAFVAALEAAGQVPITQVSAAPPRARDPAKIAALMSHVEKRVADRRETEKAKPAEARELPPPDLYVRGSPDMSADPPLEWHPNHSVELPADPRLFTPAALIQIAAGKFQRNLARVLPGLARDAGPVLEIGAASGFLGLHLRKADPGLTVVQTEGDAGFATAQGRIAARNRIEGPLAGNDDLPGLVTVLRPGTLILGDPTLDHDAIARLVRAADCRTVVLTGRLWAERHAVRQSIVASLAAAGLVHRLPLDAMYALGLARKQPG
jgi:hypothetical protein